VGGGGHPPQGLEKRGIKKKNSGLAEGKSTWLKGGGETKKKRYGKKSSQGRTGGEKLWKEEEKETTCFINKGGSRPIEKTEWKKCWKKGQRKKEMVSESKGRSPIGKLERAGGRVELGRGGRCWKKKGKTKGTKGGKGIKKKLRYILTSTLGFI